MRAYLDIGSFSARSLVIDEIDTDGKFVAPSIVDRKCSGRGRGGFVNMDQVKVDLLSLSNRIVDDIAQAALPHYSVLVGDNNSVAGMRQFSVEMRGSTVRENDLVYLQRRIDLGVNKKYFPLHRIPVGYRVNDGELVDNPVGMAADTLTLYVFVIAVTVTELQNYQKVTRHANFPVKRYVFDGLAHGLAALRESHLLTATVIEFGAVNTNISFWHNGKPVFMKSIPVGMDNLTIELVRRMNCSTAEAERIKKNRGFDISLKPVAYTLSDNKTQSSMVSEAFYQIMSVEMGKILGLVVEAMDTSSWPEFSSGYRDKVIVTGGARTMTGLQKFVHTAMQVDVVTARGHQMSNGETAFMGCLGQFYLEEDDLGQAGLLKAANIVQSQGLWERFKNIFS